FLEMILAARGQICLSYTGRDARTGDAREPSPLIRELQYLMRGYATPDAIESMTVEHRMSRYDLSYFPDLPGADDEERARRLASFDEDARRGAAMAALRRDLAAHAGSVPPEMDVIAALPAPTRDKIRLNLRLTDSPKDFREADTARPEIAISISALTRFLECPLQAGARYGLGMTEDAARDDDSDAEPVEQTAVDRSRLLREAFWNSAGDQAAVPARYAELSTIARLTGHAPAGPFALGAEKRDIELLHDWIDHARETGAEDLARWEDIRIGAADESFRADRILAPIILDVLMGGPDRKPSPARITIHGTVRRIAPNRGAALRCVARKGTKPSDFLPLVMAAIALSAAGEPLPKEFRAIVATEESASVRNFAPMSPAQAREYFAALVQDLLSGPADYFLPIEAVAAALKAKDKSARGRVAAINAIRAADSFCASDRGPLRKSAARAFSPPSPKLLDSIIARRFQPIIGIFANDSEESAE
ncbi:MAG TPA: hypothetical protein VMT58_06510, partial [Candidatus Binataceae bacterium]|nr:hypothetical protein [Candidatus Binataceae bacterium]